MALLNDLVSRHRVIFNEFPWILRQLLECCEAEVNLDVARQTSPMPPLPSCSMIL